MAFNKALCYKRECIVCVWGDVTVCQYQLYVQCFVRVVIFSFVQKTFNTKVSFAFIAKKVHTRGQKTILKQVKQNMCVVVINNDCNSSCYWTAFFIDIVHISIENTEALINFTVMYFFFFFEFQINVFEVKDPIKYGGNLSSWKVWMSLMTKTSWQEDQFV